MRTILPNFQAITPTPQEVMTKNTKLREYTIHEYWSLSVGPPITDSVSGVRQGSPTGTEDQIIFWGWTAS